MNLNCNTINFKDPQKIIKVKYFQEERKKNLPFWQLLSKVLCIAIDAVEVSTLK